MLTRNDKDLLSVLTVMHYALFKEYFFTMMYLIRLLVLFMLPSTYLVIVKFDPMCEILCFMAYQTNYWAIFFCPGKKWVPGGIKACTPSPNQWKDQGYNPYWQSVLWGWCFPNSSLRWETLQISRWKGHQEESLCAWKDIECYRRSTKGKDLIIALAFPFISLRVRSSR